jgi:hypothetical protein
MPDPVSLAGLGLAILPLILFAIENYEHIFEPAIIFAHGGGTEAGKFQLALDVQRTQFENSCRLLLKTVTSHTDDMITDRQHPLWWDRDLDERFKARLGDSFRACVSALTLIQEALDRAVKDYGGLNVLTLSKVRIPPDFPPRRATDLAANLWCQEERKKNNASRRQRLRALLRVSFTSSDRTRTIDKLRKGNWDLHHLYKQIINLGTVDLPPIMNGTKSLSQFGLVRKASRKLHEVLSGLWPCKARAEHHASIGLRAHVQQNDQTARVHFNLAWVCHTHGQDPAGRRAPIYLGIETLSEVSIPPDSTLLSDTDASLHSRVHVDSATDLCSVEDLCAQLERQKPLNSTSRPGCAGFLQDSAKSKHFIFPKAEHDLTYHSLTSLRDVLIMNKDSRLGLPLNDKMFLATSLATAILQYHSTPWLKDELHSGSVRFFGEMDYTKSPLTAPYISTPFCALTTPNAKDPTQQPTAALAPNSLLYSLGIMLIELAFETPVDGPEDHAGGVDQQRLSHHQTVKRLAEMVGQKVGPRYRVVVQRCLECRFETVQTELEDVSLQRAFYYSVVCELEQCLQAVSYF